MRLEHVPDEEDILHMRDDALVMEYIRNPSITYKHIDVHRFICAVMIFFANNHHQKARAELHHTVVVLSFRDLQGVVVQATLPTKPGTLTCVISESSLDVNGTDAHGRKTGFITLQRFEFESPRYRGLDVIIHNLIQ